MIAMFSSSILLNVAIEFAAISIGRQAGGTHAIGAQIVVVLL